MIRSKHVRIGSRGSDLALFQAKEVSEKLSARGIATEIVEISSDGDTDLVTPLYEMGIQGIFTKSLDVALLENRIDIAVHSTKDVPTRQAKGLTLCTVLDRTTPFDCLVLPFGKNTADLSGNGIIATSSLRRKLQWLHRYRHHTTESLRGNIQTRLQKLDASPWLGAIFAQAGLERLQITSHHCITLDWMLPSPAQGAIGIVCREDDSFVLDSCKAIGDRSTEIGVAIERDFLAALHGGCAVPIAAHAQVQAGKIFFRGNLLSLDAVEKCEVIMTFDLSDAAVAGRLAANKILLQGGEAIIKTYRKE